MVLIFPANVDQDGNGIVDLEVCVLEHRQAHIEPHFNLNLFALFVHDVLEIDLKVVKKIPNRLALSSDVEVVHL